MAKTTITQYDNVYQMANDQLELIDAIISNCTQYYNPVKALVDIRNDVRRFVGDHNDFLLTLSSTQTENQAYIYKLLCREKSASARRLSVLSKIEIGTCTRHLNSLVRKGLATTEKLDTLYYKAIL